MGSKQFVGVTGVTLGTPFVVNVVSKTVVDVVDNAMTVGTTVAALVVMFNVLSEAVE